MTGCHQAESNRKPLQATGLPLALGTSHAIQEYSIYKLLASLNEAIRNLQEEIEKRMASMGPENKWK